ncbi:hypothetical protein [Chryseobacterium sp. CBo1]|uniref:hypothetical protein n=1 Tax=Chryseobacterium sp. CBo1 TaxID=1869230 RepID=UPI000F513159|nr:hypothetical protein [Chryseobacterium sp. CBo1]
MQGRKNFTPQLFYELSLDRLVPMDNFYRKISFEVDFQFLYSSTKQYYGQPNGGIILKFKETTQIFCPKKKAKLKFKTFPK